MTKDTIIRDVVFLLYAGGCYAILAIGSIATIIFLVVFGLSP